METKKRKRGGSRKGIPNQHTGLLKDAILKAAENAGHVIWANAKSGKRTPIPGGGLVHYLQHQALAEPSSFMSLLGKILPMQLAGEGDGPVTVVIQRGLGD